MRVVGDSTLVVLLPAAAGQLDGVGTHARARRGVHGDAVLRVTASAGGSPAPATVGEPEAGAAVDAVDGHRGGRAKAAVESAASRTPGVSVSAARGLGRAGRSGMELRHHVHPAPLVTGCSGGPFHVATGSISSCRYQSLRQTRACASGRRGRSARFGGGSPDGASESRVLPRACGDGCVDGSAPRRGPRVPDAHKCRTSGSVTRTSRDTTTELES